MKLPCILALMPLLVVADLFELYSRTREFCIENGWIARFGDALINLLGRTEPVEQIYDCDAVAAARKILRDSDGLMAFYPRFSSAAIYLNKTCHTSDTCEYPDPDKFAQDWRKDNKDTIVYTFGCSMLKKKYEGKYWSLLYCLLDYKKNLTTYPEFQKAMKELKVEEEMQ
ncbi:unnamed protein product [Cylicocyclus nassatus]|uniref:Uncharacterized protein n=1 Tax=Cylicocyclus nassatus TaxID=53992 RepID=A0AA36GEA5_CYLNA|nr:unnamed protein product [Cylicocyclus nassatus]